jgi:exonuclease SbcC
MHITRLELQNIKSHRDSKYVFERGTTAIVGQNGAGKTTILEAIAWTLFDLIDYKKDDFVSRGQKKGSVRVSFISGADDREYEVFRDTGTSYYAYDPQLKTKIADKREEVQRFLWTHLGVEPGTDLKTLFRRAIGVPQGTATAIFLEAPLERRQAFDKLLKVEEYRQGAEKLRETEKYIETRIASVREKIARAEGQLERANETKIEHGELVNEIDRIRNDVSERDALLRDKKNELSMLEERARTIADLKSEVEKISSQMDSVRSLLTQASNSLKESLAALETLDRCRVGHEVHMDALERLKDLETKRVDREKLNTECTEVTGSLIRVASEIERLLEESARSDEARSKIEELTPMIAEQTRLENLRQALGDRAAEIKAAEESLKGVDAAIARLREAYKANRDALKKAEEGLESASKMESLQARDLTLGREIATLRSTIEYNDRFRAEIQKGLCPILSEKCLNLKPGQTLESFVAEGSAELTARLSELEDEVVSVRAELALSSAAQKIASSIDTFRTRDAEIAAEGKALKEERDRIVALIDGKDGVAEEAATIAKELSKLDNPSARLAVLREIADSSDVTKEKLSAARIVEENLLSRKNALESETDRFASLDEEIKDAFLKRDESEADHKNFIANEKLGAKRGELQLQISELEARLAELSDGHGKSSSALADVSAGYDVSLHINISEAVRADEALLIESRTQLRSCEERATRLAEELKKIEEVRESQQDEMREKDRLEEVLEVTAFIRDTLREAAPRVARNYVHHVSLEAAQMFREITGNPEFTLKWTEDYGIILEESGYERPFVSLSGGEQMVASLAVRLALLKQMSDIRLAFFDEPTTNMDADRRERLAEQISQITQRRTFEQLFVISHDDTFESYVDNLITVGDDF